MITEHPKSRFESVRPFERHRSVEQRRVLHFESAVFQSQCVVTDPREVSRVVDIVLLMVKFASHSAGGSLDVSGTAEFRDESSTRFECVRDQLEDRVLIVDPV